MGIDIAYLDLLEYKAKEAKEGKVFHKEFSDFSNEFLVSHLINKNIDINKSSDKFNKRCSYANS